MNDPVTLDTIVTIVGAVLLFWRLHSGLESVRKELKSDIREVRLASETAHKEIVQRLGNIEIIQSAHTERVKCIDDKVTAIQRRTESAS